MNKQEWSSNTFFF